MPELKPVSIKKYHSGLATALEENGPSATYKELELFSMVCEVLKTVKGRAYEDNVLVLTDKIDDVRTLTPGYYMRFIQFSNGFHLYGFEVFYDEKNKANDVRVHENIPRSSFEKHKDTLYIEQLRQLKQEGKVIFYRAEPGMGLELHARAAQYYAEHGQIDSAAKQYIEIGQKALAAKPNIEPGRSTPTPRPTVNKSTYSDSSNETRGNTISSSGAPVGSDEKKQGPSSVSANKSSINQADKAAKDKIMRLLEALNSQIKRETKSIKNDAEKVYQALRDVFEQYQKNKIDEKACHQQMKDVVTDALPKFDKAPTWKTFFLNFLRKLANIFLSKDKQYQMFRPVTHKGLQDIQSELDEDAPKPKS